MISPRALLRAAIGTSAALCVATAVGTVPAQASGGTSVSTTPSSVMPYLASPNSTISQLVQCGPDMYAVGHFSAIFSPLGGGHTYVKHNIFRFDARTGAVSSWYPHTNNSIFTIALSADCNKVFIGGDFSKVNGHAKHYLARVTGRSGVTYHQFKAGPDNPVYTLKRIHANLLVGGSFTTIGGARRTAMASVDRTTGTATSYLNLRVTGALPASGPTKIFKFAVSPKQDAMLALGNYTSVDNHPRQQMVMLKLHTSDVVVGRWYAPGLMKPCNASESYYVRAATWSPDAANIYIATTGDKGASPYCDVAAGFTSTPRGTHNPLWTNATGCDSLYAVAADTSAVYIGGHERWINNENGCDNLGAGASTRPGVGAVSRTTGRALAWDPQRAQGHGADDMLRTRDGLWVASDNFFDAVTCGHQNHPGLCFFPNG